MLSLGSEPSAIRELFSYGLARKAEIGEDNVFDFSLGNPSVPAPKSVAKALERAASQSGQTIHGYTPASGAYGTRQAIVENLNRRFSTHYTADDIYLTCGAAASLSITLRAITSGNPHKQEEVIVLNPFFPEYRVWIEQASCKVVEVATNPKTFQIDIAAIQSALTAKTRAIIINSPNNPVGTVYSEESLIELGKVLRVASKDFGHPIYLMSDEPYREIVYDSAPSWIADAYEHTMVCYSWSNSLRLPGERIGYILVGNKVADASDVRYAIAGAGRALGYVCAPALFQYVIEQCIDEPCDIDTYKHNGNLLYTELSRMGYTCIRPQGAFYLWVKALEGDAQAFSQRAKAHELLIVPSNSFGIPGWVRLGYCVSEETIKNSLPAFQDLFNEYASN